MTSQRTHSGVVITVLTAVALTSVVVTLVGLRREPGAGPDGARLAAVSTPASTPAAPRPEMAAAAVLAAWDAERSAAWAAGDLRRLLSLYVAGSAAGRHDVAMLSRWLDRGLVVRDLHTQVLDLDAVSRSGDTWVVSVTDRVVGGLAVGHGTRTLLPNDGPTTRTVTLRQVGRTWLVASVSSR